MIKATTAWYRKLTDLLLSWLKCEIMKYPSMEETPSWRNVALGEDMIANPPRQRQRELVKCFRDNRGWKRRDGKLCWISIVLFMFANLENADYSPTEVRNVLTCFNYDSEDQ